MSEAAANDRGREIWIEKYRPQRLDEIVGHEGITQRLQQYIEQDDLPHLLFAGPAGTGKCLTGETPVLTSGGLERIENVVGDQVGFADPDEDLEVVTFDERDGFDYVAPSHVYGKEADELVRVTTRDGNDITVTPEHRLLTIDTEGVSWKRAGALASGDRVVRPLEAPLPDADLEIDWIDALDGDRIFVHVTEAFAERHRIPVTEDHVGSKKEVFEGIRLGETDREITDRTGIPLGTVREHRRQSADVDLEETSTVCSLSHLRSLDVDRGTLREHVVGIQHVAPNNRRSRPIEPPWEVSTELATLLGLALAEARISRTRIKFYNTDDGLLEQFSAAARETFGVDPREGVQKDVPYREIGNRTLIHYLRRCFAVFDESECLGSRILRASTECRRAFLQAFFDTEAHVQDGGIIELPQKDGDRITLLSYLLAAEGIPTRRKTKRKAATNGSGPKREYHLLFVSGASSLSRFQEAVGFTIPEKAGRLETNADRDSNPNHDTVPVQAAVDELCDELYLRKSELLTDSLNPETPGRENYLADVDRVVAAATEKIEIAQSTLGTIRRLESDVERIEALPATWVGERDCLEPIEVRRGLGEETGIRSDRLLEYSDGRRTPGRRRATNLLTRTDAVGTDVINLLENEDHALATTARFRTVAERVEEITLGMLSGGVLEGLQALETLASRDLYFDTVESTESVEETRRVYDLTVPGTRNYVAGDVPTVMHNTTSAIAIAKQIYGDDWQENFLELNASDQRGIDVVRDRIKSFARASFGGYDHRIIFLDEADALCVPPGTEVVTGYPSSPEVKAIEDVAEEGEPIPSVDFETNEIQADKGKLVDSGVADFFELDLADGRTVLASLSHPFFVVGDDGKLVEKELRELEPGDEIADFEDDVGVSRCEICGRWTAGRFCSLDCKNDGHSLEIQGDGNPMYDTEWSEERREKIVEKLSDGRFAGESNPNHGGEFHGIPVWEMDEERIEQFREKISEMRSGTGWDEWVVDADPEEVKTQIGRSCAEWWEGSTLHERARLRRKAVGDDELPHHEHYELDEFDPALVSDGGIRTVQTVEVRHIEHSHRGKAYNISMEDTPNFMLANGILTHNTSDAQSALRRTMEQFSDNTRFILSCNYSSQIIDPIQSRCAVFRFSPLGEDAVAEQIRVIADAEGIELTDDGVDALVYAADGDMRKAINGLQAAAVMGGPVDEEAVYTITSTARPEEIREMVTEALDGDFTAARAQLDTLLTDVGIAGGDVIDQMHRSVWDFDLEERAAVQLMERIGEADYRITAGANEQIQLEALLASLATEEE